MKFFFVIGIFIVISTSLFAQATTKIIKDFRVEFTDPRGAERRAIVRDYTGGKNSIRIDPSFDGVLTEIGDNALRGKNLVSIDIQSIEKIGLGAFADNPLTTIIISENVDLNGRGFSSTFVAYYNSKQKAEGKYTYDTSLRRWFTEDDRRKYDADEKRRKDQEAEARRKAEEEARRKRIAEEQARQSQPSSSYSSRDDVEGCVLGGFYLNAGYYDYFGYGPAIQLGLAFNPGGDFELDILGQAEAGISMGTLCSYGVGAIGEVYFGDDWGLGFGMGFTKGVMEVLSNNYDRMSYWRGALLLRESSWRSSEYKVSIYGDLFSNSQWRFGVSILFYAD